MNDRWYNNFKPCSPKKTACGSSPIGPFLGPRLGRQKCDRERAIPTCVVPPPHCQVPQSSCAVQQPPPQPSCETDYHSWPYKAALKLHRGWKLDRLRLVEFELSKMDTIIDMQVEELEKCGQWLSEISQHYQQAKIDCKETTPIQEKFNLVWLSCQGHKYKLKRAELKRKCLLHCLEHLKECISIVDKLWVGANPS